jgi:hypothetical protein
MESEIEPFFVYGEKTCSKKLYHFIKTNYHHKAFNDKLGGTRQGYK